MKRSNRGPDLVVAAPLDCLLLAVWRWAVILASLAPLAPPVTALAVLRGGL